ncbi:MAG: hydrogenase expression/formation protein HypE [Bryobacteraceae bacterium]|nr:hydrogenase expression/formation protein HypE [Bryobacteraceae bacterium]
MSEFSLACPAPLAERERVLMAHGGGGRLMRELIERLFAPRFSPEHETDAALLALGAKRLAFTTDSFVVSPPFFPGGDIGSLAVHGTVNDLAMMGAEPVALSAAFILEEGLELDVLRRVADSMAAAARAAGVRIVTGDTKVVERGRADQLYITTSGVGVLIHDGELAPWRVAEGDEIVLSGDIGRHGMAVMSAREGLAFEPEILSDSAPLHREALGLLRHGIRVHCMRDLTRGGLASAVIEIARAGKADIELEESRIPVREDVRAACELLGLDPLYVANEGRFVAFVAEGDGGRAAALLPGGTVIGRVKKPGAGAVTLRSVIGATRMLDLLSGEQLPRIC